MTYRRIGDLTGTHPETVRRYMQGQSPSVEFVAALAGALSLSAEWLLTGRGPMKQEDAKNHALQNAKATDLLSAVATTMERVIERVDRLERYAQSLGVQLRAAQNGSSNHHDAPRTAAPEARARLIADAVAQRPSPDAR